MKTEDIPKLDGKTAGRIRQAVETGLITAPQEYGEPPRRTLKGYRRLRAGDHHAVYLS